MTELVLAVFDADSAANAAIQDLEVARIPSAVIQRGVRNNSSASARPLVTVTVDEMHALAVTGILDQYGPLEIEERAARTTKNPRGVRFGKRMTKLSRPTTRVPCYLSSRPNMRVLARAPRQGTAWRDAKRVRKPRHRVSPKGLPARLAYREAAGWLAYSEYEDQVRHI
jgi:hypothetical protein